VLRTHAALAVAAAAIGPGAAKPYALATAAIAINDLQVKVAQIEQEKRKIAEAIREQVALEVLEFDATRREFQISQEIARRATTQHRLLEIDYRFSDRIDSVSYLGRLSQLDQTKASTYRAWARLRTRMARIQMLVLGSEGG
jgi:ribosome maturation protein Sdo1